MEKKFILLGFVIFLLLVIFISGCERVSETEKEKETWRWGGWRGWRWRRPWGNSYPNYPGRIIWKNPIAEYVPPSLDLGTKVAFHNYEECLNENKDLKDKEEFCCQKIFSMTCEDVYKTKGF